ncbi:alkaline phosphatase family protein [Halomicrobium salinisoli]|uniref:alkaline phosphatase family protein n=1 Tax=Halomicrobium salinisoli TaxID=2878391 RepID=UPI001CF00755|nr:nucleotide pyrophosphatase/phosphodiesterase family protein [Halomicrobium salinisoli]
MTSERICLIDAVGLTPELIGDHTPVLQSLSEAGGPTGAQPLTGVTPAVTLTPQASVLTGSPPSQHGAVTNGWLYDTQEIRLWQQARQLMQGETIYEAAKEEFGDSFTTALIFSWFSQGALAADYRVIPKPWYGSDGNKVFDIHGAPASYVKDLTDTLGEFPFHTFWGPQSGSAATEWIADATAKTLRERRPNLTITYLPVLDYPFQKHGPDHPKSREALTKLDEYVGRIREAAEETGTKLVLFSEYGITSVSRPVHLNRLFREQGWLSVRYGPFGEQLDVPQSEVFAVADHQVAHVYVRDPDRVSTVKSLLEDVDGVGEVWGEAEKEAHHLDHPRSGELVALAEPDSWFTYYFWFNDDRAPDYARTVAIHDKPGYDPVEMFFDPDLTYPKLTAALTLAKKKLGFRYRMNLIPLNASLVQGSHGLPPASPEKGPVLVSPDLTPPEDPTMLDIKPWLLEEYRP